MASILRTAAYGQSTETPVTQTTQKKSHLLLEEDYLSNTSYQGRTDSVRYPIWCTYMKYTTARNFYISGNMVHDSTGKLMDELDVSGGKKFRLTDSWKSGINYTHIFSGTRTKRIKTAISNYLNLYSALDWNWLYSKVSLDYSIGKNSSGKKKNINYGSNNDVCLTLSNSHDFYIDNFINKNDELTLTPGFDILYGTQNFLARFYSRKDAAFLTDASKMELLAYQLSFDINYETGNWGFDADPFLNIPKNVPQSSKAPAALIIELSLYYKFDHKSMKDPGQNPTKKG